MSLYAGINIKDAPSSSASGSGAGAAPSGSPSSQSAVDTRNDPHASSASTPLTSSSNGQWSAALRFAPVPRKKATTTTAPSRPLYASISALTSATASTGTSAGIGASSTSSSASKTQPYAPAASSSSLPPKHDPTSSIRPRSQITRPPPMTLDENDVNGFAQTAQGKRAAKKAAYLHSASGAYGPSSGGMGPGPKKQKELVLFGDDVPYDPLRPCDYSAYKAYVQGLRKQRRLEREEEERARRRARSYSGSSDYTSSEGEAEENDDRANKKARLFAPPTSYDSVDPTQAASTTTASTPAPAPAPEFAMKREETGEEAYLRRLAMSSGAANKPPGVAMPSSAPPPPPPSRAAVPPPLQLSASSPFIPSFAPPLPAFTPQTNLPSSSDPPKPYSANETIQGRIDPSNVQLSEAQIRAKEIAEKLGRLAKMANGGVEGSGSSIGIGIGGVDAASASASASMGVVPPMGDFQPAEGAYEPSLPFAQRMMAKFGWEKGKGLGATESGMTSALSVSKNPAPSKKNTSTPSSSSSTTTPSTIAAHSNRIIDRSKEARRTQQDHQWGEPSRIVLLTNLCTVSELDDDLTHEVAEEAAKFGVVERCLYRIMRNGEGEEEVRVFLVMSGLAGGYNGCRTFDGRFFGGKTVRARYYDEEAFRRGEWGL